MDRNQLYFNQIIHTSTPTTQFIHYEPPFQTEISENFNEPNEPVQNSNYHWSESETRTLLSYLSDNFELYRKNKKQFYAKAAIKIGNNKISANVKYKIQKLLTRYQEENKEETGKGKSQWLYLNEMNEIFRNRENVTPDYRISSITIDKVCKYNFIANLY